MLASACVLNTTQHLRNTVYCGKQRWSSFELVKFKIRLDSIMFQMRYMTQSLAENEIY